MRIEIAERLKPFSHTPGSYFLLPGSSLRFQIFPALIRIDELSGKEPILYKEIPLDIQGPAQQFTVMQDLEKGRITVWGHSAKSYFRYHIMALQNGDDPFAIFVDKKPADCKLLCSAELSAKALFQAENQERLSLGNHKSQDWDLMNLRKDMREIFPLWLRLGNLVSYRTGTEKDNTLLQRCQEAIENREKEKILETFYFLYLAGFEKGLSPRLIDGDYQGFDLPPVKGNTPLVLLSEGANLIRSLFVQWDEKSIHILPALPPEFHCGRLLHVETPHGVISLEWTKKMIRRMIFTAKVENKITFTFPKEVKTYRLKQSKVEKGTAVDCNSPLTMFSGQTYWFDLFEK